MPVDSDSPIRNLLKVRTVRCALVLYKGNYIPSPAPNPTIGISFNPAIAIRYKHLTLFVTVDRRTNGDTKPAKLKLYGQINDPEIKKIAKAKNKKRAVLTALKKGGLNENTSEIELGQALQSS